MARVRKKAEPQAQLPLVVDGTRDRATRRRAPWVAEFNVVKLQAELEAMIKANEFAAAKPLHFVLLYKKMHLECYGVEAIDCGREDMLPAAQKAGSILERHFDGSGEAMADFVAWTWVREKKREEWRRSNGRSGQRIGWRLQFNASLLTDYKVDLARNPHG